MTDERAVVRDSLASRASRMSRGYFAVGLFIGAAIATGFYLNLSGCEPEQSTLWFCGESSEIVLATLAFLNDLAKAIAWPLAAIVVVWLFRGELKLLLPKLRKVGLSGAEFEGHTQKGVDSPDAKLELTDVSLNELRDPVAKSVEKSIFDALDNIANENRINVLVRSLTEARMFQGFERYYANIFGSQIEALQLLNTQNVARSEAIDLLKELKAERGILEGWNIDMYMAFLKDAGFVAEESGEYRITETGKNFLHFIVANGLPVDRPN